MGGEKFVGNLKVTIFMFMCLCLFVWYPVINVYMFENLYHHNSGESTRLYLLESWPFNLSYYCNFKDKNIVTDLNDSLLALRNNR